MRNRFSALLFTGGAAVLALGLSATSSFAATAATWTVSPGGAITGKAGTTTLTDTTSGITLSCMSSNLTGSLKSGKGLPGKGLGTITSTSFNKCTVLSITISLTSGKVAWKLNASSYNKTTGVTSGTITGIHVAIKNSLCTAVIDGTSATAHNGMVNVTYSNKTHVLKILPKGSNLHVWGVPKGGCDGAIKNKDTGTISGSYTLSPAQKITSP